MSGIRRLERPASSRGLKIGSLFFPPDHTSQGLFGSDYFIFGEGYYTTQDGRKKTHPSAYVEGVGVVGVNENENPSEKESWKKMDCIGL